jgi:hypothetical protein
VYHFSSSSGSLLAAMKPKNHKVFTQVCGFLFQLYTKSWHKILPGQSCKMCVTAGPFFFVNSVAYTDRGSRPPCY